MQIKTAELKKNSERKKEKNINQTKKCIQRGYLCHMRVARPMVTTAKVR